MKKLMSYENKQRIWDFLYLAVGLLILGFVLMKFRPDFSRLSSFSEPLMYFFVAFFASILKMLLRVLFPEDNTAWWFFNMIGFVLIAIFIFFPKAPSMEGFYDPIITAVWFVVISLWLCIALFWGIRR